MFIDVKLFSDSHIFNTTDDGTQPQIGKTNSCQKMGVTVSFFYHTVGAIYGQSYETYQYQPLTNMYCMVTVSNRPYHNQVYHIQFRTVTDR